MTGIRTYVVLCYVFMGGVVAGACDTGIKPTATIAAPDSADQVLFGMSHYVTDAGIQRAHVRADTAYFYSPAQTAELRNVHITFYDTRGAETSTLTSHLPSSGRVGAPSPRPFARRPARAEP